MDELCLPEKRTFSAADVQRIWSRTRMSQPIFAVMVGVGASTVAQWAQSNNKPSRASARLLDVIDRKGIEAISAAA
jgi:putative transcriptional regulator